MAEAGDAPVALTIGTAGHVDHGKTTLVRYMTGTDTDRLEEEHRRGISIVPGYAELVLPGGMRASLVDVPGHERFVKNMVAGATGVDAFLLVVAADDGVMPQTREHLDVLRVLGVEEGVVALTKADAVDRETAELARLDVEELLESVGIEAPVVEASGATGEGVNDLLRELDALAGRVAREDRGGREELARLPVDRAFVLKGIGVVVTGTLWSGEIRAGDTLHTPTGLRPRVRGVQNHGRPAEVARAGARTALDLVGVGISEIHAGDVLLSRPVAPSRLFDARVRLLEGMPGGSRLLRHGARLRLHHGTRATGARVRLSDRAEVTPGSDALARLRLDEPLVLLPGDRFVLRAANPRVTVGGGTVLDPAPAGRRPDPDWLRALERGDAEKTVPHVVARAGARGMTVGEISLSAGVPPSVASEVAVASPELATVGDLHAPAELIGAAREGLLAALGDRANARPESPELSVAAARSATGLSGRLADALLALLSDGGEILVAEAGVSLPAAGGASPDLEKEARDLLDRLRAAGAEPPAAEPTPAMRLLLKRGEVVEISRNLYAAREAEEAVLDEVRTACVEEGGVTLAGFRDRLGTSRKFAQAWLEHADAAGVTARTGDVRVLTRRHRQAVE